MKRYLTGLLKFLSFNGRASRKEYLFTILITSILSFGSINFVITLGDSADLLELLFEFNLFITSIVLSTLLLLFSIFAIVSVTIRRLHDIGLNSWFFLISLIPIIGTLPFLVLMLKRSNEGENIYGVNTSDDILTKEIKNNFLKKTASGFFIFIAIAIGFILLNKKSKFSTACDCREFATTNSIKLPNNGDIFTLMDSFLVDEAQILYYREVLSRVDSIRSKYPTNFKEECVDKFGENEILGAACTEKEIKQKLLNEAISFMQNRCNQINQQLVKYQVTKTDNGLIFLFMSVAPNGDACISRISENNPIEIISSDCGSAEEKSADWDAVSEYEL